MQERRQSDEIERRFGERIRELRTAAGLSQPALAEALADHGGPRLDPSGLARLERGQRRVALGEAAILARILGASLDEVISSGELPTPPPQITADVALVERELTGTLERVRAVRGRLKVAQAFPLTDEEAEQEAALQAAHYAKRRAERDAARERGEGG